MSIDVERLTTEFAGRYTIEETLGSGGMSTVFRAVDLHHGREVAIKVLRPELSFGVGADRFQREIETAARLNHPRIVPLFDSDQISGLLYYVMPLVDGESLKSRLKREQQLPLPDALRITREVGEALQHAHERGVVHRDVTPGNVLLTASGAVVTDFGIAKSGEPEDVEPLTRTGQAMGTLGYMSPEQASGERSLDARSDQYSLGCLLFEMLTGEPPHVGRSTRSILAKQLGQPVPSAALIRETVPEAVDSALKTALAKAPADRFRSITDFTAALESKAGGEPSSQPTPRSVMAGWLAAAVIVFALGTWATLTREDTVASDADVIPDSSRYALFKFAGAADLQPGLSEIQRLEEAMDAWEGMTVVSQLQLAPSVAALDSPLSLETAARLAREQGAGRFIWGEVQPLGDSIRVRAGLFDAATNGVELSDYTFRVAASFEQADSLFSAMALELLFRGDPPDDAPGTVSASLPAAKDTRRGLRAVENWDLESAEQAFESARSHDPEYARANLWLALTRHWLGSPLTEWELAAAKAYDLRAQLADGDRVAAAAIDAEARGEPEACTAWKRLTSVESASYYEWYGLANCLTNDRAVVEDTDSPSAWAFRSSYRQALAAYEAAFRLRPAILSSFSRTSYQPLRRLYKVSGNQRRAGESGDLTFDAAPTWVADTLAYIPYPSGSGAPRPVDELTATGEAVSRLREMLVRVARNWSAQAPRDGDAKHALGLALALVGDGTAVDTLRAARALIEEPWDRRRVATSEVWVQLAMSLPEDARGIRRARSLADSLLADSVAAVPLDPELGVKLATLTGRAALSARYAREAAEHAAESPDQQFSGAFDSPEPLAGSGPPLLVYSSLGGPPDSILALERQVAAAIENGISPNQRELNVSQWLILPATLAFPVEFGGQATFPRGDWVFDAQRAWARGDADSVRASLADIEGMLQGVLPPYRTLDSLYPEAMLWWLLGEPAAVASLLDPTLGTLEQADPSVVSLPQHTGALVRAAALRALAADALGRPGEAAAWARSVMILWSDADPHQLETVAVMRGLSE